MPNVKGISLENMVEPVWERQPGESPKSFHAFVVYRDLPPFERTIKKAIEIVYEGNVSPSRLNYWYQRSSAWHWRRRAEAFDEYKARVAAEAQLQAIREMNERHATIAVAMISKAAQRLKTLPETELSPTEVRQWFVEAAKLERVARGAPETITETQGNIVVDVTWGSGAWNDENSETAGED